MNPEEAVRRYWGEIWGEGRFELADRFYAPTYRENLDSMTPGAFAEGAAVWRAHFSDFRVDIEELFTAGSRVVTRVTYRGTHTGDFKAAPASGRTIEQSGIDIFEFDDEGLVRQHWHETDHLVLFRHLGAKLVASEA